MNKNNTYKSKEESFSLDFEESNLKVNKNDNQGLSALLIGKKSKGEISSKTNNSIKQSGKGSLLVQPKDNTPLEGEEINRLAKTWCELLLNQMQESQSIQILRSDFEANSEENKYKDAIEPLSSAICV